MLPINAGGPLCFFVHAVHARLLAERGGRERRGRRRGEVMNVAAQKKGLAYSIPWRLVCRGRANKALDLETPPAPKTPSEAILCVHSILNVYQKKNKGKTVLGWPFCLFLFTPSFLFATPKRADKPRARTNDANNGLKINSFLPNSSACMSVPLLPTRTRAIVPPDGTCS